MNGVWTTEEVKYAVSIGYKIEQIYEILHFENKSNNLFKSYVQRFFSLKQQNGGRAKIKEGAGSNWRYDLSEQDARI